MNTTDRATAIRQNRCLVGVGASARLMTFDEAHAALDLDGSLWIECSHEHCPRWCPNWSPGQLPETETRAEFGERMAERYVRADGSLR